MLKQQYSTYIAAIEPLRFEALLGQTEQLNVIGSGSGQKIPEEVLRLSPDFLLLDGVLTGLDSLNLLELLRAQMPTPPRVLYLGREERWLNLASLKGADHAMLWNCTDGDLIHSALRTVEKPPNGNSAKICGFPGYTKRFKRKRLYMHGGIHACLRAAAQHVLYGQAVSLNCFRFRHDSFRGGKGNPDSRGKHMALRQPECDSIPLWLFGGCRTGKAHQCGVSGHVGRTRTAGTVSPHDPKNTIKTGENGKNGLNLPDLANF